MKKFACILFFILIGNVQLFAQEDKPVNQVRNFVAKIKSGEVVLLWKIVNPERISKIIIENKKAGESEFEKLSEVLFNNFRKKEEADSLIVYSYTKSVKVEQNGVYFFKISLLDDKNESITSEQIKLGISEIAEIKLHQNNPNPFNPVTTITYEVLVPTRVMLQVYTLTGKRVAELVDAFKNPGTYSVEFNANNYGELSSGIYFYKLTTSYSSDIKKMILTK